VVEPQFAGYRVVDTLGSGALATIYKAEQESLGRTVAIKAL
jgi:serine/threonine protein kinase